MQQQKLALPSSRYYLCRSSRKEGQANFPQQGASFSGSILRIGEVSFLTLSLVSGGTRASIFGGFPPQSSKKDLTQKLASKRCIFSSKQNSQTPSLGNQGFSGKPQVSQLQNQVGCLKSIRSKSLLFPFEVLI